MKRIDHANDLKERFPWLGTDKDAGSGADVIQQLCEWYEELKALDAEFTPEEISALRDVVRGDYDESDIDVDENPVISANGGNPGVYVMAWAWVDFEEAGLGARCRECGKKLDYGPEDEPSDLCDACAGPDETVVNDTCDECGDRHTPDTECGSI